MRNSPFSSLVRSKIIELSGRKLDAVKVEDRSSDPKIFRMIGFGSCRTRIIPGPVEPFARLSMPHQEIDPNSNCYELVSGSFFQKAMLYWN